MNDKFIKKDNGLSCYSPMDCCQPARKGSGHRNKNWRTVAFIVVIIGALTAAVYSLYSGVSVEATMPDVENTQSATPTVPENAEKGVAGKRENTTVYSLDDLNRIAAAHECLFVVLEDENDSAKDIKAIAVTAAKKAEKKESNIGVVELSKDAAGFSTIANLFGVKEYPAVLIMKKDGTVKPIHGEISEKRLLQAYLDVCGTGTSCINGKGSKGCDPKVCDPADCE